MGNAYAAKAAAAVPVTIPTGWPAWWPFPTTDAGPWAPGWPKSTEDILSLVVNAASTVAVGSAMSLEATILKNGIDTSEYANHLIKVTAAIGSTAIGLKKNPGDGYTNAIYYQATNYTGIKYGFSQNVYLNVSAGDIGQTVTFTCSIVSISPVITGTDTTQVTGAAGILEFETSAYNISEAGPTVTLTVKRLGGSAGAVSCSYATANGSASAGSDYTAASGSVSWADLDVADKPIVVSISEDAIVEGNETFSVTLSAPLGGATLGALSTAIVTIEDNDVAAERGYVYYGYAPGNSRKCKEYTPSSDSWLFKTDAPVVARGRLAGAAISNKAYSFYGYDGSSLLLDAEEFSPLPNTWASKTDGVAPARYDHAAFAIGTKGYCAGGDDGARIADCDEFDAVGNSWASKTDIPSPARSNLSAATLSGNGYIFGGNSVSSYYADCDEYNQAGNSWASKTDLPSPVRALCGGMNVLDKGYVTGGYGGGALSDNDEFTPGSNSWASKANLPAAIYAHGSSEIGDKGYVYGGVGSAACRQYTPGTDSWSTKQSIGANWSYMCSCSLTS